MSKELSDRQVEIIEAASRILTLEGVGGLTIKNLAKEMKFSESAIYRHFTSKEEIIIAMLTFLADSIDQRLSNISGSSDPEEHFKALFREQFRFFDLHPQFVVAVFSDGLMEETQRINDAILKLMSIKMKHLMPDIMEGQQKGVFTNAITTDEMVHIVMGAFKLQMFKWRTANFQFDLKQSGENMIQSILTLIRTK
ncbi:MAG: TetR/AcrR family transcriptional regulator [Bacteroidetes bacterium]|nr:TetR/AcrR family transcriptional regulator [Bacteroidota bacterium]